MKIVALHWLLFAAMLSAAGAASGQGITLGGGDIPAGTFFPEALSRHVGAALPTAAYISAVTKNIEFERLATQLATTQALSPRVKSFAARMAADAQRSTVLLRKAGAEVEPAMERGDMDASQDALLYRLRQAQGETFDQLYLQGQLREQLTLLQLHTNYRYRGSAQRVRRVASHEIPVVEWHLSLLNSMRGLAGRGN